MTQEHRQAILMAAKVRKLGAANKNATRQEKYVIRFKLSPGKAQEQSISSRGLQVELAAQVKERSSNTSGAKRGRAKKEKGFLNFTRRLTGRQVCFRPGRCSVTQAPQQGVT